jgi:hypothetical protein
MSVSTPNVPNPVQVPKVPDPVQVERARVRIAEDLHLLASQSTTFPSREEFLGSIHPESYIEFDIVDVNEAFRQVLELIYQDEPSL